MKGKQYLNIVHPEIESYLETLGPAPDTFLEEMDTKAKELWFPHVGPEVGRFLYLVTRMSGAETVFEMGSGFGYSAYWFALALPDHGRVIATDPNSDYRNYAEAVFSRANIPQKLEFITGDGLQAAEEYPEQVAIVFNDIDKEDYPKTIDIAWRRLKPGGLFITDNVLWYGNFLRENPDTASLAVKEFNEKLAADARFETSWIPMRDGIALARKI